MFGLLFNKHILEKLYTYKVERVIYRRYKQENQFSLKKKWMVPSKIPSISSSMAGRLLSGGARGPGVFFIIPCVDMYEKIDMRVQNFDVPPQEVL